MPVLAQRLIRKMRGGAQAHMIEASDGACYVVKFRNNPQHRRIVTNEWIASVLLDYLEIAQPKTAMIEVTETFLGENPDVFIQLGSRRLEVDPGWHFGSQYPGDPRCQAVYDFIPDNLFERVVNLRHFLGVLAFDKWVGNADARQSIFFRARVSDWMPAVNAPPQKTGFIAQMVDHGYIFDGSHWDFPDSPLYGLYFRPEIYRFVTSFADFQPWLDRVMHFPEEVLDKAYRQIPDAWLNGDREALEAILEKLFRRRKRVPDLIRECSRARVDPFPNWRE